MDKISEVTSHGNLNQAQNKIFLSSFPTTSILLKYYTMMHKWLIYWNNTFK